jgi:predicted metal-dependent peptidase
MATCSCKKNGRTKKIREVNFAQGQDFGLVFDEKFNSQNKEKEERKMSNNNGATTLITRAKTAIILDHVFFATLILKMVYVPDTEIKTACTNGKEIRFNSTYFTNIGLKHVIAVIAHEVLHCVFGHHTRRGNRDPKIWNIACDLAINLLLIEYGFQLPSGALIDNSLRGLTAEEIYDRIMRDANGNSKYKGIPDVNGDGDPGGMGRVDDAVDEDGEPAGEAEKSYQDTDWKISATQAANLASKAGKLPSGMKRLIEERISPKLPWEEILYKYVDSYSYNDFSWLPPNRKYMNQGIYLPSVRSKELKGLYFGCDASGSVRNAELGLIASSLNYIAGNFNAELTTLWFDTAVHHHQKFYSGDVINLEPVGGGGTDFRAPFIWLDKKGITPNVLIIFTDLECDSYPKPEPDFPVIWITWKKTGWAKPPFGEVIVM